ncbi:hypothetical protein SLS60_007092 [Paraconiothyrium brasiliense]|uniref:Uncharacterized protein n=1 Tax=Paraconiothyrium brasiliense TaxID=300254 RepID=A0ABR3R975_9PLEO
MPPEDFRRFKEDLREETKKFTKLLHDACILIIANHIRNDPRKDAEVKSMEDDDWRKGGYLEVGKISTKYIDNNQPGEVGVALYYEGDNTFPFNINKTHPQWLHFIYNRCEKLELTEHDMEPEDEKFDPESPDSLSIDGQVVKAVRDFTDPHNEAYSCQIVYRFEAPRKNEADIPAPEDESVDEITASPA